MSKPKLLICVSRFPFPLEKGDKLRAYHQIKELSNYFEICLCALSTKKISQYQVNKLKKYCLEVYVFRLSKCLIYFNLLKNIFSDKPFQVVYFYQKLIHKKIKKVSKKFNPSHIYCQLVRTAEYFKSEFVIPKTLDYMDALSKGMERRIGSEGFIMNFLIREEFRRLLNYESVMYDYFNNHTIISKQDQFHILHSKNSDIFIIPNGVDTEFFKPKINDKKFDLVFVGNMSYAPNVKAVKRLVNEILPSLNNDTTLLISGSNPSSEVLSLASKNVKISGWVDDIRNSYLCAKIFVAPMDIGTGLQNKILEAMSLGLFCVTTSLVNNAIGATDKKDLFVADTNHDFVQLISQLLSLKDEENYFNSNARKFVENNFEWKNSCVPLINLLKN